MGACNGRLKQPTPQFTTATTAAWTPTIQRATTGTQEGQPPLLAPRQQSLVEEPTYKCYPVPHFNALQITIDSSQYLLILTDDASADCASSSDSTVAEAAPAAVATLLLRKPHAYVRNADAALAVEVEPSVQLVVMTTKYVLLPVVSRRLLESRRSGTTSSSPLSAATECHIPQFEVNQLLHQAKTELMCQNVPAAWDAAQLIAQFSHILHRTTDEKTLEITAERHRETLAEAFRLPQSLQSQSSRYCSFAAARQQQLLAAIGDSCVNSDQPSSVPPHSAAISAPVSRDFINSNYPRENSPCSHSMLADPLTSGASTEANWIPLLWSSETWSRDEEKPSLIRISVFPRRAIYKRTLKDGIKHACPVSTHDSVTVRYTKLHIHPTGSALTELDRLQIQRSFENHLHLLREGSVEPKGKMREETLAWMSPERILSASLKSTVLRKSVLTAAVFFMNLHEIAAVFSPLSSHASTTQPLSAPQSTTIYLVRLMRISSQDNSKPTSFRSSLLLGWLKQEMQLLANETKLSAAETRRCSWRRRGHAGCWMLTHPGHFFLSPLVNKPDTTASINDPFGLEGSGTRTYHVDNDTIVDCLDRFSTPLHEAVSTAAGDASNFAVFCVALQQAQTNEFFRVIKASSQFPSAPTTPSVLFLTSTSSIFSEVPRDATLYWHSIVVFTRMNHRLNAAHAVEKLKAEIAALTNRPCGAVTACYYCNPSRLFFRVAGQQPTEWSVLVVLNDGQLGVSLADMTEWGNQVRSATEPPLTTFHNGARLLKLQNSKGVALDFGCPPPPPPLNMIQLKLRLAPPDMSLGSFVYLVWAATRDTAPADVSALLMAHVAVELMYIHGRLASTQEEAESAGQIGEKLDTYGFLETLPALLAFCLCPISLPVKILTTPACEVSREFVRVLRTEWKNPNFISLVAHLNFGLLRTERQIEYSLVFAAFAANAAGMATDAVGMGATQQSLNHFLPHPRIVQLLSSAKSIPFPGDSHGGTISDQDTLLQQAASREWQISQLSPLLLTQISRLNRMARLQSPKDVSQGTIDNLIGLIDGTPPSYTRKNAQLEGPLDNHASIWVPFDTNIQWPDRFWMNFPDADEFKRRLPPQWKQADDVWKMHFLEMSTLRSCLPRVPFSSSQEVFEVCTMSAVRCLVAGSLLRVILSRDSDKWSQTLAALSGLLPLCHDIVQEMLTAVAAAEHPDHSMLLRPDTLAGCHVASALFELSCGNDIAMAKARLLQAWSVVSTDHLNGASSSPLILLAGHLLSAMGRLSGWDLHLIQDIELGCRQSRAAMFTNFPLPLGPPDTSGIDDAAAIQQHLHTYALPLIIFLYSHRGCLSARPWDLPAVLSTTMICRTFEIPTTAIFTLGNNGSAASLGIGLPRCMRHDPSLYDAMPHLKNEDEQWKNLGTDLWFTNTFVQVPSFNAASNPTVCSASAGEHHFAVVLDGELRCWGDNRHGQCGLPATPVGNPCVRLAHVQSIHESQIGATDTNTASERNVQSTNVTKPLLHYDNDFALPTAVPTPSKPVMPVVKVQSVACGAKFTAVLTVEGQLLMAGDNSDGCVGNGHTLPTPNDFSFQPLNPAAVTDEVFKWLNLSLQQCDRWRVYWHERLLRVATVACGSMHAALVDSLGGLWVWGQNEAFQLGYSSATQIVPLPMRLRVFALPVGPLAVENIRKALQKLLTRLFLRPGTENEALRYICVRTATTSLTEPLLIVAFTDGILMRYSGINPSEVNGLLPFELTFMEIACGEGHTIAAGKVKNQLDDDYSTDAVQLFSWGQGAFGQLGIKLADKHQFSLSPVDLLQRNGGRLVYTDEGNLRKSPCLVGIVKGQRFAIADGDTAPSPAVLLPSALGNLSLYAGGAITIIKPESGLYLLAAGCNDWQLLIDSTNVDVVHPIQLIDFSTDPIAHVFCCCTVSRLFLVFASGTAKGRGFAGPHHCTGARSSDSVADYKCFEAQRERLLRSSKGAAVGSHVLRIPAPWRPSLVVGTADSTLCVASCQKAPGPGASVSAASRVNSVSSSEVKPLSRRASWSLRRSCLPDENQSPPQLKQQPVFQLATVVNRRRPSIAGTEAVTNQVRATSLQVGKWLLRGVIAANELVAKAVAEEQERLQRRNNEAF